MKTLINVVKSFISLTKEICGGGKIYAYYGDISVYVNDFYSQLGGTGFRNMNYPQVVPMKGKNPIIVINEYAKKLEHIHLITLLSIAEYQLTLPSWSTDAKKHLDHYLDIYDLPHYIVGADAHAALVMGKYNVLSTLYRLLSLTNDTSLLKELSLRIKKVEELSDTVCSKKRSNLQIL